MLYESQNLSVATCDGVATLFLHFPGSPVNSWNHARLAELSAALSLIEREPGLEIAVIRSGLPGGFCGGFDPEAIDECKSDSDAAMFALTGQQVCEQLRNAPFVSIAFIEGRCLGPGWDIALTCDDRLAVAGPTSALCFGAATTGWGGFTRLKNRIGEATAKQFFGVPRTPREAVQLGAIDHAFCERRAKIELQTWLDRRQFNLRKRRAGWRSWFTSTEAGYALERQQFAEAIRFGYPEIVHETYEPLPRAITIRGDRREAMEYAMRGVRVTLIDAFTVAETDFTARGRLTPLEASQAMKLITIVKDVEEPTSVESRQLQYAA